MDREQAKKLVRETFENPFDKERFTLFIKNLLKHIEEKTFILSGNYIKDSFEKYISSYERIGKYNGGKHDIDILIVKLKKETSIERARAMQRNFVARYLNGGRGGRLKDAALVAFVSPSEDDWRFSFVKMDYKFDENGKVKDEFTPARRWSFLVGKNESSHTAQSRFIPILEDDENTPALKDFEKAFNIETVTNEFYEKYYALFVKLKTNLDKILEIDKTVKDEFEIKKIAPSSFAKKLLGQIVFLYFLQKKGWFGVIRDAEWGTGPKDFLRRLFNKKIIDYANFFNDILEPLFYEALAQPRDYNFYSRFNCKIPFLNGGLFDPLNNYDWVHIDILLQDSLFSNNEATKEGDKGDGILDVFDRYNFTVKEDEPLEKEVAIDPEMLGKVFENLLESEERKKQGTFYTPREIVHYMCKESLINYLWTECKDIVDIKEIRKLISVGELVIENETAAVSKGKETRDYPFKIDEKIRENPKLFDEKLASVKICDPACGSGAFLVGMMGEITAARNLLSIYINLNRQVYDFKRECIENSLYGVDIETGAVEIAKLRLWLSLIVDENNIEQIKPLPNLDYRIVGGDSLMGIDKNKDINFFNSGSFDKLEEYKENIVEETNHEKRNDLRKNIDELINSVTEGKKNFDFEIYFSEVFRDKGGFDIVIANPPYIRQEKIRELKPLLQKYSVYNSTSDIYTYFYERSFNILKTGGFSCFITSNKWMRAKYGQKLREFLKSKTFIKDIVDFGGHKVFESATVDTNILLFQKPEASDRPSYIPLNIKDNSIGILSIKSDFNKEYDLYDYFKKNGLEVKQASLDLNCFTFGNDAVMNIKAKIEKIGTPLKDWDVKICYGIKTGLNEAFIIDTAKREEILRNCETEKERQMTEEIIKPILRGKDIDKYAYKWADRWIIVIPAGWTKNINVDKKNPEEFFIETYPSLYKYLNNYKEKAQKRDDQGDYFWELRPCAYYNEFEKEKIVWSDISTKPNFTILPKNIYFNNTIYMISGEDLKYINGVLNSKIIEWYFPLITPRLGEKGQRFFKIFTENIPIPKISEKEQQPIVSLVDKILQTKAKNPNADTSGFERQIDLLVYKLYNLTEEEINLIENYN